jgi:hypothetical protein
VTEERGGPANLAYHSVVLPIRQVRYCAAALNPAWCNIQYMQQEKGVCAWHVPGCKDVLQHCHWCTTVLHQMLWLDWVT